MNRFLNIFRKVENQSDWYHSFKELYEHRDALFLNLCLHYPDDAWWSRYHSDGTEAFGWNWVVVGIGKELGSQITYHINTRDFKYWDNFRSSIKELKHAPLWDRHTSNDVVFRLKTRQFTKSNLWKNI